MRMLIIGASGFAGQYLFRRYSGSGAVGTYHGRKLAGMLELDITNREQVREIFAETKPETVIMPAAYSNVNGCEEKPEKSYNVNVLGPMSVAEECRQSSAKLVFFSSSYVFDGKSGPYSEGDKPNPLSVYGRHKLEAESVVTARLPDALIIRTISVYGFDLNSKNFAMGIMQDLGRGMKREVPDDQYGNPTYVENLVDGVSRLLEKGKSGIYNVAGKDYCSRYEFAIRIAQAFKLDKSLIIPVKTDAFKAKVAPRPLKDGLKTGKMERETAFAPIGITEGLGRMQDEIQGNRH